MSDTTNGVRGAPCSGRFLLRIDPGLHEALRRAAAASGVSLNEYCARKLAAPVGELAAFDLGAAAVRRAAAVAGGSLIAVVAFGSWARRELHDLSDVDLLVVVDHSLDLSRSLYARWDEDPLIAGNHRVEPHFVHLPATAPDAVGLWAEAAVDGIVLFARDLAIASVMAALRRQIADGRVRRKSAHGQPYWVMEGSA
jgi:hypothetical protein